VETLAREFLLAYEAHGPRGLVLVPRARAAQIDGLRLPDSELYDLLHDLEGALERHDRAAASERATELGARAPQHRLTLLAQRALASYDANPFALERTARTALGRYPDEPTWLLSLLTAMRQTSTPGRIVQQLEEVCRSERSHPVFREMLASEIGSDARLLASSRRQLRQVARQLRDSGSTLGLLAQCSWKAMEFDRALELYRFAACLDPTNDGWAETYFQAAAARGRAEHALEFLVAREQQFRKRSPRPALTLSKALESLDRAEEAFVVLDRAVAARPTDGDLLRAAAVAHARYGQFELAQHSLLAAEPHSARSAWMRCGAAVAAFMGEHQRALDLWREVVAAEPLAEDAHAALAVRLSTVCGRREARAHVAAASSRFPEHPGLLELHIHWLSGEDPRDIESALRRLIAIEPTHAWARRELVLTLAKLGQLKDAKTELETALAIAPHEASAQLAQARVAELEGESEGAKRAYATALELSADCTIAISALIESARDSKECIELLAAIEERVTAESVSGEGVAAWYHAASRHLPSDDLARRLGRLRERRPDIWHVWSCSAMHHAAHGDVNVALELANSLTQKFPLVPGSWLQLAQVFGLREELARSMEALERALAIAPAFTSAALALAETLDRAGAADRGLSAIERALRHQPLEATLLLAKADALWRLKQREAALATVRGAIEADPSSSGGWTRLAEWERQNTGFDLAGVVRAMLDERPWDVELRIRLADLQSEAAPQAALATIRRAIELDPLSVEAHDLHAVIAARLGERDSAEAACTPHQLSAALPIPLRGRRAWIAAAFGDVREALDQMQQVVRDRPDYAWGWQQIADFAEQLGEKSTALKAAQAMVRLDPNAAFVHGYLGQAFLDTGDSERARRSFRRALELDPSYRFAAHRYVELLLAGGELDRAEQTIERLARHASASDAAYWRLTLASAAKDWPRAEAAARALFADEDSPEQVLEDGRLALASLDATRTAVLLGELALTSAGPARLGAVWARSMTSTSAVPSALAVRRLRAASEQRAAAALAVVFNQLGDDARGLRALWLTLWHWRFVRSCDELWGSAGYAFVRADFRLLSVLWHWGYRQRQPSAWMVLNLAVSLRYLGLWRAAANASRYALALSPDNSFPMHRCWLAFDAALAGGKDEVQSQLGAVNKSGLDEFYGRLHDLCRALLQLDAEAVPSTRAEGVAHCFEALSRIAPHRALATFSLEGIQWRRAARRIGRSGPVATVVSGYWDTLLAPLVLVLLLVAAATGHSAVVGKAAMYWAVYTTVRAVRRL
jgi:tetratricopeptide (TPR) repeat protein